MIIRTLGRFRCKFSLDTVTFYYTAASDDPYKAAISMGTVSAAANALYPYVNNAFKVRNWDVRASADFMAESPVIYLRLAGSFEIWELMYIAAAFSAEFLNSMYNINPQ